MFLYQYLNRQLQSDKIINQVTSGIALFFVKYPIEVIATAILKKMKQTTISPLITLKTWKYYICHRPTFAYFRFSLGANVFAPIIEELFMRGLIQNTLKNVALTCMDNRNATVFSVTTTSVLFVIPHHLFPLGVFDKSMSNFITINHFINSVFFGLAKEMSEGFIAPISLHFFHNLINVELIDKRTNTEILVQ